MANYIAVECNHCMKEERTELELIDQSSQMYTRTGTGILTPKGWLLVMVESDQDRGRQCASAEFPWIHICPECFEKFNEFMNLKASDLNTTTVQRENRKRILGKHE